MITMQDTERLFAAIMQLDWVQWCITRMEQQQGETLDDSNIAPAKYRQPLRYSMDHDHIVTRDIVSGDLETVADADALKREIYEDALSRLRQREQRQPEQYARQPVKPTPQPMPQPSSWSEVIKPTARPLAFTQQTVADLAKLASQPAEQYTRTPSEDDKLNARVLERFSKLQAMGVYKSFDAIRAELS